jgi:predicted membrane protein
MIDNFFIYFFLAIIYCLLGLIFIVGFYVFSLCLIQSFKDRAKERKYIMARELYKKDYGIDAPENANLI